MPNSSKIVSLTEKQLTSDRNWFTFSFPTVNTKLKNIEAITTNKKTADRIVAVPGFMILKNDILFQSFLLQYWYVDN